MPGEDAGKAHAASAELSIRVELVAHAFPSPPGPVGIIYPVGLTEDDLPAVLKQARAWVALLEDRVTDTFPQRYSSAYWKLFKEYEAPPTQGQIAKEIGFDRKHVYRLRRKHNVPDPPPRPDP